MNSYDVLVIGGGIAGVSIGYELATDRSVGLLEMEATLAFHTTGRSVATFLESYGGRTIRMLTTASRAFMQDPPEGFGRPLLKPLPLIWVAPEADVDAMHAMHAAVVELVPDMRVLTAEEAIDATKVIRPDWVAGGLLEPGASEIDVAALHGGYAGALRARGGEIHTSSGVAEMRRVGDRWHVTDRSGNIYEASVVVNAAGSWCDIVAGIAGAQPVGIHPLRRTVFTIGPPADIDSHTIPLVADVAGTFYLKPEGPQILCSPADEVPSEPCDARPEEVDIAMAIDVINAATTLDIRHVRSSWAGSAQLRGRPLPRRRVRRPGRGPLLVRRPGWLRHPDLTGAREGRGIAGAVGQLARRPHFSRPRRRGVGPRTPRQPRRTRRSLSSALISTKCCPWAPPWC